MYTGNCEDGMTSAAFRRAVDRKSLCEARNCRMSEKTDGEWRSMGFFLLKEDYRKVKKWIYRIYF